MKKPKNFFKSCFSEGRIFLSHNSGLLVLVKTSTKEGFHSEIVVVISIGLLRILWIGQALATDINRSV